MLAIEYSSDFKKDLKRSTFQGRDVAKLFVPIAMLANHTALPPQYRDHPLKGQWKGYRELHIEADWLLIYSIANGTLFLGRTGTHAELFKK